MNRTTQLMIGLGTGWVLLIVIQFAIPLDTQAPGFKRFETPITPAGYAFSIWGVIFLLQGLGSVLPWADKSQSSTAVMAQAVAPGWLVGWACQSCWSLISVSQQHKEPSDQTPVAFWAALIFLLGGHVAMSLAFRNAVRAWNELQASGAGAASLTAACAFYVLPSAMNAAWLGLASLLGMLIVAISHGADFDQVITPGLVLLPMATATILVQPWTWAGSCKEAASRHTRSREALPVHHHDHTHDAHGGHDGSVDDVKLKHASSSAVSAQHNNNHGNGHKRPWGRVVGSAAYAAVLAWGLAGIANAQRPSKVHAEVHVLLAFVPVLFIVSLLTYGHAEHAARTRAAEKQPLISSGGSDQE